jgi:hypothetical protein
MVSEFSCYLIKEDATFKETKIASGKQTDDGGNKPYHACPVNVSHCFKKCACVVLAI